MFVDVEYKKKTVRSEAALKHLEPSSNGGRNARGNEARLNAITDPAANHSAKVMEKLEIAKACLFKKQRTFCFVEYKWGSVGRLWVKM